jgi:hypothetical protein
VNRRKESGRSVARTLCGFIAGFFATLIFHQLALEILWTAGMAPYGPFNMKPTHPFGIPVVFSLACWGGVWGILYASLEGVFPRGWLRWLTAFLFGALLPAAAALLIVLPLKGLPLGGGWRLPLLTTVFLVNGAWGIGTALILKLLFARRQGPVDGPS